MTTADRSALARSAPARCGWPGLAHHAVDAGFEPLDVLAQPLALGGVRGGVDGQPQRGHRRTQPVREVGGGLPFGLEQLADPAGQLVERIADLTDLARTVGDDATIEIATAQVVGDAGDRYERRGQPAGQDDRGEHRRGDQAGGQRDQQDPRARHTVVQVGAGHRDPDHRRPRRRCHGQVDLGAVRPVSRVDA